MTRIALPALLALVACSGKDQDTSETGAPVDTMDTEDTVDTMDTMDTEDTVDTVDTAPTWDPRFDGLVAALEADLAASDAPGVSVAILEHGEVVFALGLGSARPDSDLAVTPDTLFQIGSTTKMLTSIATLQKVEDGAIGLDTTLAEAYPDSEFAYDDTWNDQVTVHHMLTHQGGFYDYFDWAAGSDDADLAAWHETVFFPYLWLMNPSGLFWNYSNPNFDLAGLIVEAHDDRYYPDIMAQDVFAPLGMTRTTQRKAEAEADGDYALGVGYIIYSNGTSTYGAVGLDDVPDIASARPAGAGTWTTPTQMLEVARFFLDGDPAVLDDALRAEMTTSQVSLELSPDDSGYGYGWFVHPGVSLAEDAYYPMPIWQHGGNTLSYSSEFWVLPDQDFAISILSSGYGTDFSTSVATALLLAEGLPTPIAEPPWPLDPSTFDRHVGSYIDAYNVGDAEVTLDGEDLHIEMPFLESLGYVVGDTLEPISSDIFYVYLNGYGYDLTFLAPSDEPASAYARNRAFVLSRVEEGDSPPKAAPDPEAARRALRAARLPKVPLVGPRIPLPVPR